MRLDVKFTSNNQTFEIGFSESQSGFSAMFGSLQIVTLLPDGAAYEGSYTVRPSIDAQTLPTNQKYMTDDLTVQAIPYSEVSNQSGGMTATIG